MNRACKNSIYARDKKPQKFAEGGIAKIRHDQATKSGQPKDPKQLSNSCVYY